MKQYDFALAWNSGSKENFVKWVRKECSLRELRFLLVTEKNVEKIIDDLEKEKLTIRFLLDNEADYDDKKNLFARLCYAVKDSDGYVICDPDDARQASNKAVTHYDLIKAKIPVPYTIVVRNWEPDDFSLSKEEVKQLGTPFIIKPASGFGQKGVIKNANGSIAEIAQARHFNKGDDFLLQEKIEPLVIDDRQAWFRVYFLFGEIIPCWWNTDTGGYSHVTLREMYNFRLLPLARITSEIARVANMDFFSSEIAITGKGKDRRFVAIDYVNDQPELCVRSEKGKFGPLPEIVQHIAERIAETAWRMLRGIPAGMYRSIWLAKARLEDESI
jgi:glutathione synthase/RimK-type ligase-like ATP-grasp enzyme